MMPSKNKILILVLRRLATCTNLRDPSAPALLESVLWCLRGCICYQRIYTCSLYLYQPDCWQWPDWLDSDATAEKAIREMAGLLYPEAMDGSLRVSMDEMTERKAEKGREDSAYYQNRKSEMELKWAENEAVWAAEAEEIERARGQEVRRTTTDSMKDELAALWREKYGRVFGEALEQGSGR